MEEIYLERKRVCLDHIRVVSLGNGEPFEASENKPKCTWGTVVDVFAFARVSIFAISTFYSTANECNAYGQSSGPTRAFQQPTIGEGAGETVQSQEGDEEVDGFHPEDRTRQMETRN